MQKKIKVKLSKKIEFNDKKAEVKEEKKQKEEIKDIKDDQEETLEDFVDFLSSDATPVLSRIADEKPIEVLEEDLADIPIQNKKEENNAIRYSNINSPYTPLGSEGVSSDYKLMMSKGGIPTINTERKERGIGFVNPEFNQMDNYSKPGGNELSEYRTQTEEDTEIERSLPGQRRKNF